MKFNKDDRGWVNLDEEKEGKPKNIKETESFEENGEVYTPYAVSKSYKFPIWLKACLGKWWVAGMSFYFIFFGMEEFINQDVLVLIVGIIMGLVVDIFLNRAFRDSSSVGHDYKKYIFVGRKSSFFTMPINIVYCFVLTVISAGFINALVIWFHVSDPDNFMFTVGGVLFPTFVLLADLLFVLMRNIIEKLVKKNREKKQNKLDKFNSEKVEQNQFESQIVQNEQSIKTDSIVDNNDLEIKSNEINDNNNSDSKIQ